ncbi:DMT family transporter [Novosphingobium lentum]|uniref:DMT family transporter n=1 Tax=Novosphingobium lentum TaxID=145287 RepID=UPI000836C0BB|nr:DMT family transporter [Novosphingobium lentum]
MTTAAVSLDPQKPRAVHFAALMLGNVALALGPWSVRLADSGPVSAGFWRLALAVPLLVLLAWRSGQPLTGFSPKAWLAVAAAGALFAFDLASWHIGIETTRLGNATLFGNSGSLILMVWGVIAARRLPRALEVAAMAAALAGAAILLGRSMEVDATSLVGDLFCILAGFFYAFYILLLQDARGRFGGWALLVHASIAGAPVLLAIALLRGEPVWPHHWWPLLALALGSQVIGQGLLVYALKHFPPLVIGLALLTQPAVSVLAGWFAFGETVGWLDGAGMALVALALVMARKADAPLEDAVAPDDG